MSAGWGAVPAAAHIAVETAAHVAAALPLLIWLYLLGARGGFWRVSRHLSREAPGSLGPRRTRLSGRLGPSGRLGSFGTGGPSGSGAPARIGGPECQSGPAPPRRVVAIIPARNEAPVIGEAVRSLLAQDFTGPVHLIVVDDGSTDGTAEAALAAAAQARAADSSAATRRLTVLRGAPLPPGWSGKLWAMSQGVAAAASLNPDYLLLTDADIQHEQGNVAALVASAESQGWDLVSSMVRLSTATFAEKCLIPAFVFFFFKLYPPAWIASKRSQAAGAAGGCMLIRRAALARIGGLATIRSTIIDDCALAATVKAAGGSVSLGLTRLARSLRVYGSFAEIGRMIARTAFHQLRHSYLLLGATLLGLGLTYLLPPLLLVTGDPTDMALGAAAWALMSVAYLPMVRFYGLSPLWAPALPAIAAFYAGATLWSAAQYRRGRGGEWKGRVQDARAGG